MYAGLIVIMILGIVLTYGLQSIEGVLMPWRRRREQRHVVEPIEGCVAGERRFVCGLLTRT
jgi:type II secretory pathway pseudopilin PulG